MRNLGPLHCEILNTDFYKKKKAKPKNLLMTISLISSFISLKKIYTQVFFHYLLKINHAVDTSVNIHEKIFFLYELIPV